MPDAMDRHADAETRERLTRDPLMTRRGGWWGIAFVLAIAVVAGAVSLPTAKSSGDYIRAFYAAHAQLIIVQQILEILALVLFVGFVVALQRRLGGGRWLLAAAALVVAAEVGTNVPPLILAISNPSAQTAHTLTVVEDLADATLFASIALFAIAVALKTSSWLRALSLIVGVLTLTRAVAGPLGVTILDTVAPIAFLALVLAVSIHMLITRPGRQAA
ncbi:MAG TPA: hypothetical protein VIK45_21975 [Candidatus Dormibacteraeota bacterium]